MAARIGWVMRMARLTPVGRDPLTLEDLAAEVGTSSSRLHRMETGKLRDGSLVDACERAFGRPEGSLRAPIDITCRTFPYGPRDQNGASPLTTVAAVSRATECVSRAGVRGGDWLAWARALATPGAVGMPESVASELIRDLVGELGRAIGPAYPSRYEALALLRCSGYGHLVVEVARAVVSDPHVQVLFDLMSAVGEAVTPDAIDWCLELLTDPRDSVMIGGALALENMAQVSGDPRFWSALVGLLVARFDETTDGSPQGEWLSHLLRLVPAHAWTSGTPRPRRALSATAKIDNWSRSRLNAHWSRCEAIAHRVTASHDLPDQPILARLIFDIGMGHHESRAVTGYMLLGCLPRLAESCAVNMGDLAENYPDPVIRARVARRLPGMLHGEFPQGAKELARGPGPRAPGPGAAAGRRRWDMCRRGRAARRAASRRPLGPGGALRRRHGRSPAAHYGRAGRSADLACRHHGSRPLVAAAGHSGAGVRSSFILRSP